jgi:hypothetical protein
MSKMGDDSICAFQKMKFENREKFTYGYKLKGATHPPILLFFSVLANF